ncbi:MAG: hypothetical protein JXA04_12260 [Gammaproteobacteria bacterium]|nr:hypothetical protein [Gammaproteobacteria bacterium]
MAKKQNPNLELLMLAVDQLGELADEMVFLGGCATGLLITDIAAPPIRVTRDVDAIVHVMSLAEYYQLSKKLRGKGFQEDLTDDAPICRWLSKNVILDIMPTDTQILGFGNNWYIPAAKNSIKVKLLSGKTINMVSTPYFLITKLEAFTGRGCGDYLMSHDIEDIVAVLDGRPELLSELKETETELVKELSDRFRTMLRDTRFVDAISGHMPSNKISQQRVPAILEKIEQISKL